VVAELSGCISRLSIIVLVAAYTWFSINGFTKYMHD
jgi:hypothetical protein